MARQSRPALVDAAALLALGMVATFGFLDTYTGLTFLVAAGTGWVLGIALAHVANVLGKPVVLLAVFTVAAFFLLGGAVVLHSEGIRGILPLPGTLTSLADQSINGWKDLLTTLAPVDGGPLLALPYLMALIAGAGGMATAGRSRSPYLPVLWPVAYLVGVILLGVLAPQGLRLIGAGFAVVGLLWITVRARRLRPQVQSSQKRWQRVALGAALLAVAAGCSLVAGPRLPLTSQDDREVLRSHVEPPFDIGQYPSPMAGFRRYTEKFAAKRPADRLYDKELFTVSGLPAGSLMRFASLDEYDGLVWRAAARSPGTTGATGSFQRVGTVVRDGATGKEREVRVTLGEAYDGVWLPLAGALSRIGFDSGRLVEQAPYFRYNLATRTGVVPTGLRAGDEYRFTAHVSDEVVDAGLEPSGDVGADIRTPVDFVGVADRWVPDTAGTARTLAVAKYLKDHGRYTDGEGDFGHYLAGHSISRLGKFTAQGRQIAGNDEQYAALLALVANESGVPARAVMGAKVPDDGVVKGKHVRIWVELKDISGAWRVLPTETFMDRTRKPEQEQPQEQELMSADAVPPPAPVRPPTVSGDSLEDGSFHKVKGEDGGWSFRLPGWLVLLGKVVGYPMLLVAVLVGLIAVAKRRRSHRRRTTGSPAQRLTAAWHDLIDHARDHGAVAYLHRTRKEQVHDSGLPNLLPLAQRVDAHVFGATGPTDADAHAIWVSVEDERVRLSAGLTRWQRFKALASLTSFRKPARLEVSP